MGLHFLLGCIAVSCLLVRSEALQAQIVFFTMVGCNLIIYFSNWSMVSVFVSIFESKRLFPKISTFGQIGVLVGAGLAMAAQIGATKNQYFVIWFIAKVLLVILGVCRATSRKFAQ